MIEEKDCFKCRCSWYQHGYEDGIKEGLKYANDLLNNFRKNYQEKMDRLLVFEREGEE